MDDQDAEGSGRGGSDNRDDLEASGSGLGPDDEDGDDDHGTDGPITFLSPSTGPEGISIDDLLALRKKSRHLHFFLIAFIIHLYFRTDMYTLTFDKLNLGRSLFLRYR